MEFKLSHFKCLIFDLDDTLVNSTLAYANALKAIGISENDPNFTRARLEVKNRIGEGHVSARNRLLYFKKMLENQNRFSARLNLELMNGYEAALAHDIERQWGTLKRKELFQQLSKSYSIGIISNENTRTQLIKLNSIDPEGQLFGCVCFSEDVGVEKPNIKIFQNFLSSTGFSVKDCCMIGDSYENDISPCESIGMSAILSREFVKKESTYRHLIDDLNSLLKM